MGRYVEMDLFVLQTPNGTQPLIPKLASPNAPLETHLDHCAKTVTCHDQVARLFTFLFLRQSLNISSKFINVFC